MPASITIEAYLCSHFTKFPSTQKDSFLILKNYVLVTMATVHREVGGFPWA